MTKLNSLAPLMATAFLAMAGVSIAGSQASATVIAENLYVLGAGGNNFYSTGSVFGAENFVLAGGATVNRISHVGHHTGGSAQPTSIDWGLYASAGTTPGALIASGNSNTFSTAIEGIVGNYELTRYIIDIGPVALGVGEFWVGFHNNGGLAFDPHWTFASSGTSFDGKSALSTNAGANWTTPYPGTNMTFRVENIAAVPEPATLTLFGLGLAGLGFARRRTRKAG